MIEQQFQLNLDRVGMLISAATVENTIQLVKIFTKNQLFTEESLYHCLSKKPIAIDCPLGSLTIVNSQQNNFDRESLLDIYIMPVSICIFD